MERMTTASYHEWLAYYQRNCGHPLAVPYTLGIGNMVSAKAAGSKNNSLELEDFVYGSKPRAGNAQDADQVINLLEGMMNRG